MGIALGGSSLTNQCKTHWMDTAKAVNPTNRRFGGLGMAERPWRIEHDVGAMTDWAWQIMEKDE